MTQLKTEKSKSFMMLQSKRLESFKDWPFREDCNCTPLKLAEAGFYHQPTDHEPDVVVCYVCQKELDGWEPNDDPWEEHKSHAPYCPLVKLQKVEEDMTFEEYLKIHLEMNLALTDTQHKNDLIKLDETVNELKKTLRSLKQL